MSASREKSELDDAIKDMEQVLLDLPYPLMIKRGESKDKKKKVVKQYMLFTDDLYHILFPFICDMKELPKLKRLCKDITLRVESHVISFLETHQSKIIKCLLQKKEKY